MKKTLLCGAVSAFALLGINAHAQEAAQDKNGNWYAELDSYASFLGNERASRGNLNVLNNYKTGVGFAGIFGYDFGTMRLELEVGTHYHSPNQLNVSTDTTLGLASGPATAGKAKAIHYMVNTVIDLDEFTGDIAVDPFIGGGLGVSSVKLRNITGTGSPAYVNSTDDVITYQAFAGLRRAVTENIDVSLKYRYMHGNDSDLIDRLGQTFSYTHDLHDVILGITYNFGDRGRDEMAKRPQAQMPAPVVATAEPEPEPIDVSPAAGTPEPAPTPAPAPVVDRGPYSIYFDWDSAFIDNDAREVIRKIMAESGKMDQITIQVDGHADRSGPNGYNDNLSFERATAVKEFMIANGVDADKILIEGHGERMLEITTDDGVRERRNRRVTIKLN